MPNAMTPLTLKAKRLLPDDYIVVGDTLYRIARVKKSKKTNDVEVQAYPVTNKPSRSITLFVERNAKFTIYNQI